MNLLNASRPLSRRSAPIATLCAAFLLLGAVDASAAIRFAAPGGNEEAGSECLQAHPCSLFNAASRFAPNTKLKEGDEVIVEPGNYSNAGNELGPEEQVVTMNNTNVHGVVGRPRPVITLNGNSGSAGFQLFAPGNVLSHVEIVAPGSDHGFLLLAGTVDGVVVRSGGVACFQEGGLIRNSACLSTGDTALKFLAFSGAIAVKLRNVTAIATGANSNGLATVSGNVVELTVDAVGVLAHGSGADVFAEAKNGAKVAIDLDHSDFADTEPKIGAGGGTATVTQPGTGTNITDLPQLAADGYHELPGSLTIDKGATDTSSGTTDIDGNQRAIGIADIGADEHGEATTTSVACSPTTVLAGTGSTTCTATVSSAAGAPTGAVALASDGPGALAGDGACTLVAASATESSCNLAYAPSAVGSGRHKLAAFYPGDAVHELSEASTSVQVDPAPAKPPPPPGPHPTPGSGAPNTTLKKKPARRTSSRLATFSFIADQPNASFQCRLDKGPFKPCRSPFKHKVKPGRRSFQVRAVSSGGKADPTPATYSWRVSR
jgi:hypothetical protein